MRRRRDRARSTGRAPDLIVRFVTPMRVLVAVDKFKGSLPATQVAAALAAGIGDVLPAAQVIELPVADGGDGTVDAALAAGWSAVPVTVRGPIGQQVRTRIAIDGERAVVELASTCGLQLMPIGSLDPMHASTHGLGEAIEAAVAHGARDIVIGLGGSASTDGGAGMLQALGARLLDDHEQQIEPGAVGLARLRTADLSGARERLDGVQLTLAGDVTNPLLGPYGAAAVYGPQKGADPAQVLQLDSLLRGFADVIADAGDLDEAAPALGIGSGAAGGAGFAAHLLGARFRPGIEIVLELIGLHAHLPGADLMITGEGSLDAQSLQGKAPIGVAAAASVHGLPVVAVAGRVALPSADLEQVGISRAYALSDVEPDPAVSMRDAARLLRVVGARIAADVDRRAQQQQDQAGTERE